jgi:hypothetical protein
MILPGDGPSLSRLGKNISDIFLGMTLFIQTTYFAAKIGVEKSIVAKDWLGIRRAGLASRRSIKWNEIRGNQRGCHAEADSSDRSVVGYRFVGGWAGRRGG